jgi:hypothetical protein
MCLGSRSRVTVSDLRPMQREDDHDHGNQGSYGNTGELRQWNDHRPLSDPLGVESTRGYQDASMARVLGITHPRLPAAIGRRRPHRP